MAKNKLIVIYIIAGFLVLFIAGGVLVRSIVRKSNSETISKEKAYTIASEDAGIDRTKVDYTKCNLEYDDGKYVYDVEFIDNDFKYEYKINAVTGQILDIERERVSTISYGGIVDIFRI